MFIKRLPTCFNSSILEIPLYLGSVSGKCFPMSPSAAAPSKESIIACNNTSASEWPNKPSSYGILTLLELNPFF